jgi:hypothetical protein
MQSNKPSADFIRFYSYRGQNYKDAIVKDLLEIFNQELSRMQTCTMRKKEIAKDKSIEISSFDKNGTKFCFNFEAEEYFAPHSIPRRITKPPNRIPRSFAGHTHMLAFRI